MRSHAWRCPRCSPSPGHGTWWSRCACGSAAPWGTGSRSAVLVSEAPARTTYGPPVTLSAPLGNDLASIHIDSTRRGPQAITVRILDSAGVPIRAQSVTASLSSPQVAALAVSMREARSGELQWTSAAAVAPLPGIWTLTFNVALDASDAYTTSASYQVW